jgi:hypothetical protein
MMTAVFRENINNSFFSFDNDNCLKLFLDISVPLFVTILAN